MRTVEVYYNGDLLWVINWGLSMAQLLKALPGGMDYEFAVAGF